MSALADRERGGAIPRRRYGGMNMEQTGKVTAGALDGPSPVEAAQSMLKRWKLREQTVERFVLSVNVANHNGLLGH